MRLCYSFAPVPSPKPLPRPAEPCKIGLPVTSLSTPPNPLTLLHAGLMAVPLLTIKLPPQDLCTCVPLTCLAPSLLLYVSTQMPGPLVLPVRHSSCLHSTRHMVVSLFDCHPSAFAAPQNVGSVSTRHLLLSCLCLQHFEQSLQAGQPSSPFLRSQIEAHGLSAERLHK